MNASLHSAYGSYPIPDVIKRLLEMSEHYNMDLIWFRIANGFFPSSITPPDLIPFADTGGDGIHFGFLTDFGRVKSLESAPIVCVTPTDDPPIRLMARNISEFLDLVISVPDAECLERWWGCSDEVQKLEEKSLIDKDFPVEFLEARDEIYHHLMMEFGASPKAVLPYFAKLLEERERSCALPTLDGLGVTGENVPLERYEFNENNPEDEAELERMQNYFNNTSSLEAKLAFIRDTNYWYVLDRNQPSPVFKLLRELMLSLGLHDEVARMFYIDV